MTGRGGGGGPSQWKGFARSMRVRTFNPTAPPSVQKRTKKHGAEMVDATMAKRVLKELNDLQQNPAEGVRVHINEHNIAEVQAEIDGPVGPYEGGVFRMRLLLAPDYPSSPPKGFFTTKIFHPNVSAAGEICVNVLKKDWAPDMGIRHVLVRALGCALGRPQQLPPQRERSACTCVRWTLCVPLRRWSSSACWCTPTLTAR